MSNFLDSKKTRTIVVVLAVIIVVIVVFVSGMAIGYRQAIFASRFGQNYYRNFYGTSGSPPMSQHGIVGAVIDVSSSTISVKNSNNNEQSIAVGSDTVIREMNNTISLSDVVAGDQVAVIGEPNQQGQIYARFIRVFDSSSSLPQPSDGN